MRVDRFTALLFVFYCLEVGLFFVVVPWLPMWARAWWWLPIDGLSTFLSSPFGRSLATGFGLLHLLWACHDLDLLLRPRPRH